jgi:hypothetical protein
MSDVRRVQLDLPQKSFERLLNLKHGTDATTYSEVIRSALKAYETLFQFSKENKKVFIRTESGDEISIVIIGM